VVPGPSEMPLSGGHMSTVVRVGDTVRRSAGRWTPTVHRLLAHARARGVSWVPEPLGYDELGREVLSFTPGDVPHQMPPWVWSEPVLTDVARALRQWHDATADFEASGSVWSLESREPREVICHSDFAPYNCVFRAGRFAGAIDFDLCAPGPRLWDIAYTAYRFVPLMPPVGSDLPDGAGERSPFDVGQGGVRLDAFLSAYAGGDVARKFSHAAVVRAVIERLGALAAWTTSHAAKTAQSELASHAEMYRAHAEWLARRP